MRLNQLWKQIMVVCLVFLTSAAMAQSVNVTIQADMNNELGTFTTVHAPGAHNGWDATTALMTDPDLDNIYEIVISVPVGIQQLYKFAKDGGVAWESGSGACGLDDGYGGYNRYFTAFNDTVISAACWNACDLCATTCDVDVTFTVNLPTAADTLGGAHIAGSFNGWTPTAMTDMGGGQYAATYTMLGGDHFAYKYLNGSDWADAESVPMDCGEDNGFGDYNRFIDPSCTDTAAAPVCFGSCYDCDYCDAGNAPGNLSSTVGATTVTMSWDAVQNSVGCQIQAHRYSPPGSSPSAKVLGLNVDSKTVPISLLGDGTSWEWKVRCACQITPVIIATPYSENDSFDVPVLRRAIEAEMQISLFPNPASDQVVLQFNNETAAQFSIEVVDMLGRTVSVDQRSLDAGQQSIQLDVANLPEGVYFLNMQTENMQISEQFTVAR